MAWNRIQEEIRQCRRCKEANYYEIRCPDDRVPSREPENVKFLFLSEAPPLRRDYFFYNENSNDRLRRNLFEILNGLGYNISSISDFVQSSFYLLPTVKCPSERSGRNKAPGKRVIRCCVEHLKREIEHIKPKGCCLLGKTALRGFKILRELWGEENERIPETLSEVAGRVIEVRIPRSGKHIKFIPSYWPTRRHGRGIFQEIGNHIRLLLESIHRQT